MFKDIISGMSGILNKDAKDMISAFAMVLIPLGLMWSIVFLPQLLMKEINKPEKCWAIQSANGKSYKINACTGALELLPEASESSPNKITDDQVGKALHDSNVKTVRESVQMTVKAEGNAIRTDTANKPLPQSDKSDN